MALTQEQEELRTYIRSFLALRSPESEVRRICENPGEFDSGLWQRMAAELGLQGVGISEQLGGSGGSWVELGIVFEELGRGLTPSPYFATAALAIPALVLSADQNAIATWLSPIIAGQCVATVAIPHAVSGTPDETGLQAQNRGGEHLLSGRVPAVIEGGIAQLLILPAKTTVDPDDATLYVVDGSATGLKRTELAGLDGTLRFADLELSDSPAVLLGSAGDARRVIEELTERACVAVASEAVGGARACLEMATDYARTRTQFDRRIGTFQAIKHRFADLALAVESAAGVARRAAEAAATDDEELRLVASLARAYCCEIYIRAAAENIQLHGGIGFTWEHTAHLHYRRAVALQNMVHSTRFHNERAAGLLGIAPTCVT